MIAAVAPVAAHVSWTEIAGVGLLAGQLLVLGIAAIVGLRQVGEAKKLREQQARPFVVVDFDVEDFLFFLRVTNIGTTLARNVTISITPPLTSSIDSTDQRVQALKIFTDGIATLAPGKELRTLFDSAIQRNRDAFPDVYIARVTYADESLKREFNEDITLDLGVYWGLQTVNRDDLHDVHARLKELVAEVKKWGGFGGGIQTLSPGEIEERHEQFRQASEARRRRAEEDAVEPDQN